MAHKTPGILKSLASYRLERGNEFFGPTRAQDRAAHRHSANLSDSYPGTFLMLDEVFADDNRGQHVCEPVFAGIGQQS